VKLEVEFDAEWWRVRGWFDRKACRVFGHPGWRPYPPGRTHEMTEALWGYLFGAPEPGELYCVRCSARHPDYPERPPYVHTFSGSGFESIEIDRWDRPFLDDPFEP
jgi:hypothetical protein